MFKPIITHKEGQYKYPGVPTVIKGSSTTMRGVPPMITVTPDGAFYANPNMDYSYLGEMGVELPLNKYGGCMDCQEQFPQAQNLNWFYKAQGGEAFPQANVYPESWVGYSGTAYAQGGMTEAYPQANVYPHMYPDGGSTEAFPQAQTYLPYDRPGETRLNGMFQYGGEDEYGGQADLESIYRIMKAGGLNKDPKKKRGGGESFYQFSMRMGGLPKAQFGPPTQLESFGLKDVVYSDQEDNSVPPAFAANALEDYEPMTNKDIRKIRRDYRKYGVDGPSMGTSLDGEEMSGDQLYAGAKGLPGRMERRAARQDERMANDAQRESDKQMRQASRDMRRMGRMNRPYNYNLDMLNAYSTLKPNKGVFDVGLGAANAVSLLGDVFGGYKQLLGAKRGYEYPGMQYEDGGYIPDFQNSLSSGLGYDPFLNASTPMQQFVQRYAAQQDSPPTIADYNQTTQGTDTMGGQDQKPKARFDLGMANMKAMSSVNKLGQINSLLEALNEPDTAELRRKLGSTDMMTPVTQQNLGDYMTNVGPDTNFRPNDMRFAQQDVNYFNQGPVLNAAYGGVMDMYQDGGVYDLTQEEIDAILAAGGSIEYI